MEFRQTTVLNLPVPRGKWWRCDAMRGVLGIFHLKFSFHPIFFLTPHVLNPLRLSPSAASPSSGTPTMSRGPPPASTGTLRDPPPTERLPWLTPSSTSRTKGS